MSSGKGKLALFDFDGTITNRDTLIEFTRFVVGSNKFFRGMIWLSPALAMQKAGLLGSQKAKENFLTYFFKDFSVEEFDKLGRDFKSKALPLMIRPGALERIQSLKSDGYRVVVVSASAYNWIEPWASSTGVELIATKLEVTNAKLTGKIEGKNCNKEEKVKRIKEAIELSDYSQIEAYGDTSGDIPMLKLATKSYFRPFRDKN
ncbi:MAG: HAD family hydrolase [Bacteroidota bacterium]